MPYGSMTSFHQITTSHSAFDYLLRVSNIDKVFNNPVAKISRNEHNKNILVIPQRSNLL